MTTFRAMRRRTFMLLRDLLAGDGDLNATALPVDGLNGCRREQHVSAEEPVTVPARSATF
jgi:hypothetical protein